MQPTRRSFLTAAGSGTAVALAGCTGPMGGAAFAASGATLPEDVQQTTRYTLHRTDTPTVTRRFEWFGLERTVEVTNVVAEYDRGVDLSLLGRRVQAAVFAAFATPEVRLLGREYNPVAGMSTTELAETVQERYERFDDVSSAESFEAPVAGRPTTVTRFDAEARLLEVGRSVDVHLYLNEAVRLGDDHVVGLAVHPTLFGRQADTVRRLLAALERRQGEGT